MQLNKSGKDDLRYMVYCKLRDVPEGQRITLDKELLEYLLFDEVVLDKEKNVKVKLPVWSGEFLQKLDLSEVDFSDVSWSILGAYFIEVSAFKVNIGDFKVADKTIERLKKISKDPYFYTEQKGCTFNRVCYSKTNANIDLTKSFEAKYGGYIELECCNFEGCDLSKIDLSELRYLEARYSHISYSNLTIPDNLELFGGHSSLVGIDLSSRTIDILGYFSGRMADLAFCNLADSGINIDIDVEKISILCKHYLHEAMPRFSGCYLNGKKVLSKNEREAIKAAKREEYEMMKEDKFASVGSQIDEKIKLIYSKKA